MGMGTQARQLHSPQTGLGLCVRARVCARRCVLVSARRCGCVHVCAPPLRRLVCSLHLFPKMPGLSAPLAPSLRAGGSSQWTFQLRTG